MSELIYRGITHTGAKAPVTRIAQDLIYRGIFHDGLRVATSTTPTVQMRYRGVRYSCESPLSVSAWGEQTRHTAAHETTAGLGAAA